MKRKKNSRKTWLEKGTTWLKSKTRRPTAVAAVEVEEAVLSAVVVQDAEERQPPRHLPLHPQSSLKLQSLQPHRFTH
jgi:hypothetical protein